MKYVKCENITIPSDPKLIFEYKDMVLNETIKSPSSFDQRRFKHLLRVNTTDRYRWSLKLTNPINFLFIRIEMLAINYTLLSQEDKDNFTLSINASVGPRRKCVLEAQLNNKKRSEAMRIDNHFVCDSISDDAYEADTNDPLDYIIFETQTSISVPLVYDPNMKISIDQCLSETIAMRL